MSIHTAKIIWKTDASESFAKNQYTRGHEWSFDGGVTVQASSSPHAVRVPFSVEAAVDPEEALVASASSCHMLSFLWVAAKAGFIIDSYEDNSVGEMTTSDEGKQWISKITLDPQRRSLTTIAGSGKRGGGGDGGSARAAEFDRPHGIGLADDGTIFIGDTLNHRVRRLTPP